jgi:hypothetical protein
MTLSGRFWSLWVLQLLLGGFHHHLMTLRHLQRVADLLTKKQIEGEAAKTINTIQETLGTTKKFCDQLELPESSKNVDRFIARIATGIDMPKLSNEIGSLLELIESEGEERFIYTIAKAKGEQWRQESQLWDDTILIKFPSAKNDANSALSCYALDQDTACIFHLMRIVELGLRALARERKVKIPKKKRLEWTEWQTVITELSKKTDLVGSWRPGPAKDNALEFYRGTLGEFQAFKDVYRNHVMHTRGHYGPTESLRVLMHVRGFLERLSSKLDEHPKKAIAWGRK